MLLAVQNAPVLRRLGQDPAPESIQDLADAIKRDRSNVSKSLAALEGEGLVHVVTVDGKRRHELTAEGRDLLPRLDVLEGKRGFPTSALELVLSEVEEDPLNPRKSFDEGALEDMADSIELRLAKGQAPLILPIAVKATPDPYLWRIVDGARRRRAIEIVEQRGKWPSGQTFSAVIREPEDDLDQELTSLVANVQREDMNAIEEAHAIERQIAGGRKPGELADALGKTRRFVEKRRQLLKLPEILQLEVARGVTSIEKALRHVQEPKAAEPEVQPQAAAGAGPNLTPAQRLIMVEVAIASHGPHGEKSALGPAVALHAIPALNKLPDAQALTAEGFLAFSTSWPAVVAILRPGRDWLQANLRLEAIGQDHLDAQQAAGVMPFEIERLAEEGRYHTEWLNRPKPLPAPVVSDAVALVLLETFDAIAAAGGYDAVCNGSRDLRDQVKAETGGRVHIYGPNYTDGMFGAQIIGDYERVLAGRWPNFRNAEGRAGALAEIRAAVLPAKDLKILVKRGGYATAWLNGPFEPDAEWKAAADKKAAEQRQRAAELAEREEWLEHVAEAIDCFETDALDMSEAQIRARFAQLLDMGRAPAPWREAEPSAGSSYYAKTAADTYVGMASSPNSRRLAILAVNIACGIPAKDWPPAAEDPEPEASAGAVGGPTKACAGCGAATAEDDLDEDGACPDCVAAEEADADAEAAAELAPGVTPAEFCNAGRS